MTGPAGDFVGAEAVAATGDSGNNPNANTTGPNSLTEPAIFISLKNRFLQTSSRADYTFRAPRAEKPETWNKPTSGN
jgi:hypothetical protein